MLLLATAPPLCLRPTDATAAVGPHPHPHPHPHPSPNPKPNPNPSPIPNPNQVGRLTNAMQYNRLKFNCAAMRCAALETPPLPVRAPRYTDATLPQPSDFGR